MISTLRGVGSGSGQNFLIRIRLRIRQKGPDPAKRSGSDWIRIPNTGIKRYKKVCSDTDIFELVLLYLPRSGSNMEMDVECKTVRFCEEERLADKLDNQMKKMKLECDDEGAFKRKKINCQIFLAGFGGVNLFDITRSILDPLPTIPIRFVVSSYAMLRSRIIFMRLRLLFLFIWQIYLIFIETATK
jgi:hypothetical protein